jgi:hypothetical protein
MTFIVNHLAHLDVWGPPDGAQVSLDGELIGTLPFTTPLPVPVGNPEMTVKASGFATVSRPLEIKARSNLREHVVMRPLQLAPAPALTAGPQAAPSPAPGITLAPPNSPQAAPVAPHEESSSIFGHWWFWTAAGVVLAGAGVGTYLALHRSNDCISSATNTCTTLTP